MARSVRRTERKGLQMRGGVHFVLSLIAACACRVAAAGHDVQNCASGGGRADYGFLRYADEFWGSDDTNARERVFIQWGESLFFPAQAIGAHVTKAPYGDLARVTPLKYRFDVAMSCRFGFELAPNDLAVDEVAFARQCVATARRARLP